MDLPNEFLSLIVGHARNRSTGSLQWLALVNRRFNKLVVGQLYADVKLPHRFESQSPYLFLRTMMSDQRLAARVTTLEIDYALAAYRLNHHRRLRSNQPVFLAEERLFATRFQALAIPLGHLWSRFCSRDQWAQILVAAALMYLPNIESLGVLDAKPRFVTFDWFRVLHSSATNDFGNAPTFARLRNITLQDSRRTPQQLFALFTIPSLRRLTIVGSHENRIYSRAGAGSFRCSLVEELRLHDTNLSGKVVRDMIEKCKSLKVFEYEATRLRRVFISEPPFPLLWGALCDHEDLERIILLGHERMESVPSSIFSTKSMRDFRHLTHLDADLRAFFESLDGDRTILLLLPGWLQEMTVFAPLDHREHDVAKETRLLDQLDGGVLPALKTLRFELHSRLEKRDEGFRAEYENKVGHKLLVETSRTHKGRKYNPDGSFEIREDATSVVVHPPGLLVPPPMERRRPPSISNEELIMLDDDKFDDVFRNLDVTPDRENLRARLRFLLEYWR